MTTSFPVSLDSFAPYPDPVSPRNDPSLAGRTNNLADAVKALEAKVGVDGSMVATSLDYKVAQLEAAPPPSLQGNWSAQDNGFIAWTYDPACCEAQDSMQASGTLLVGKVHVPVATTITNLYLFCAVAGTTTGFYGALYTGAGALLAQSANQSLNSGTLKAIPLSTPQAVPAGIYYVGFWSVYTVAPQFYKPIAVGALLNGLLAAPNMRFATADAGLTTTAPATIGAQTATSDPFWMAVA